MNYKDFKRLVVTPKGFLNVTIRSISSLDQNLETGWKVNEEITCVQELDKLKFCQFINLHTSKFTFSDISNYDFFIAIGENGTILVLQNCLGNNRG